MSRTIKVRPNPPIIPPPAERPKAAETPDAPVDSNVTSQLGERTLAETMSDIRAAEDQAWRDTSDIRL